MPEINKIELEKFVNNYTKGLKIKECFRMAIEYALHTTFNIYPDKDMEEKLYQLAMAIDMAYVNTKRCLPSISTENINKVTCLMILSEIGLI